MKKSLFLITIGLLMSFCSVAQYDNTPIVKTINFSAALSYDTAAVDELIQVTYTVNNAKVMEDFTPPNFSGLTLVAGPSISMQSSYFNGEQSSSHSYTYHIKANAVGEYWIPSATVETDAGKLMAAGVPLVIVRQVDRPAVAPSTSLEEQNPFDSNSFFGEDSFLGDALGDELDNLNIDELMDKAIQEMEKSLREEFNDLNVDDLLEEEFSDDFFENSDSKKKEKQQNKPTGKTYKL